MSMMRKRQQLRDYVARLAHLPPEEQRARLALLSPEDLLMLDTAFEAWAHEGQLPPSRDGWRSWLMMAGRGFGKTRAGAEWIYELAWSRPVRIALVGATIDEARRVMVEGTSGLLSIARRWRHKLKWEPSKGRGSGSMIRYRDGGWETGVLRGSELVIGGQRVVGARAAAIAGPAGGATVDAEARATISQVLAALRQHGLIAG